VDDFWAVLQHTDVRHVLRNPKLFSSQLRGTQIHDPATAEDPRDVRRIVLNLGEPDHPRLRSLLTRAFTPRADRADPEAETGGRGGRSRRVQLRRRRRPRTSRSSPAPRAGRPDLYA